MALSGSAEKLVISNYSTYIRLEWSATKNCTNNTFTVTSNFYIKRTDGTTSHNGYGECYCTIINGSSTSPKLYVSNIAIGGSAGTGWKKYGTYSSTHSANADGSLSIKITGKGGLMPGDSTTGLNKYVTDAMKTLSVTATMDPIGHYSVVYNANGGSGAPSTQTKVESVGLTLSSARPTRTGYAFSRWTTSSNGGGTTYYPGGTYSSNSGKTLYAQWSVNSYTVTLNANGGYCSTSSKSYSYGSKYTSLPTPSRTGYTFNGWYTASSGGSKVDGNSTLSSARNHTLYAHWTANSYTVYFNNNGGEGDRYYQTLYYDSPAYLTANRFSKTGYSFAGWATSAGGSIVNTNQAYVSNIISSGTINFYAKWNQNSYQVSFNANGGSCLILAQWFIYDAEYGDLPTPSRTGYSFAGWYTAASGGSRIYTTTTAKTAGNHTIYAHWTANTYTVYYNKNGGTSSSDSKTVTYDSGYGTITSVSRTGYSFGGWYKEASFTNPISTTTPYQIAGNSTIYAKWNPITYDLTFDPTSGCTVSPTAKEVTYDAQYGTLPTPVKANFSFVNWVLSNGSPIYSDTVVKTAGDHTVTATYSQTVYDVTIKTKIKGNVFVHQEVRCNSGSLLSDVRLNEIEQYKYKGYYFDSAFTQPIPNGYEIVSTQTIYAKFISKGVLKLVQNGLVKDYYVYAVKNIGGQLITQKQKPIPAPTNDNT